MLRLDGGVAATVWEGAPRMLAFRHMFGGNGFVQLDLDFEFITWVAGRFLAPFRFHGCLAGFWFEGLERDAHQEGFQKILHRLGHFFQFVLGVGW